LSMRCFFQFSIGKYSYSSSSCFAAVNLIVGPS
jgi:hypothetical protein